MNLMAWIKSHKELERHPKTLSLMSLMKWDLDTTIGKLHRFWWWCLDYADDGDLTEVPPETIALSIGIPPERGSEFIQAMIKCGGNKNGFIEEKPYLRIHDWWEYMGEFIRGRYRNNKKKLKTIKSKVNNSRNTHGVSTESARSLHGQELDKSREEKKREKKKIYAPQVRLKESEYERLCQEFTKEETDIAIKYLNDYVLRKGYIFKDANLTLRKWVFKAVVEDRAGRKFNNLRKIPEEKATLSATAADILEEHAWRKKNATATGN